MAKYFLGSVGKAEAFIREANGSMKLAFVSKTLTDSGLNISTTKDDIRAGEGAPIQFSFFHDANVEITLTDVLWKRDYLAAQLGATFDDTATGQIDYVTKKIQAASGKLTLTESGSTTSPVQAMPIPCENSQKYLVWYAKVGTDEWSFQSFSTAPTEITLEDSSSKDYYCVRYLGEESRARTATITSTIIPQELFLVITAPIFAGDACSASKGKAAGHITFEVPRFQLNGAQEFTMNMSQNQTMSLAGVALAAAANDCETGAGQLLRIIEVLNEENWYSDVKSLVVDEDCLVVGEEPVVYAVKKSGAILKCLNKDLCYRTTTSGAYTAMTSTYKFTTAGTMYININKGDSSTPVAFLANDEEVTVAAAS